MSKIEISQEQVAQANQNYLNYTNRLIEHLKLNHRGWPVNTCHTCLMCEQGIKSNRKIIELSKQQLKTLSESH